MLDGGSLELGRALLLLAPPREGPRLVVRRAWEISVEGSSYGFEPARETHVDVEVDFPRGGFGRQRASFDGSARRFLDEIAPARTFGFLEDAFALRARGRAKHVDPGSVLVLDEDGKALAPAAAPGPDELARHKLLDLMGDLFLHGGPPLGRVSAIRPGHAKTHLALGKALREGVCELLPSPGKNP